mmetsp:Transcript_8482/g.26458  ORF Transcript_8482/g.26458 Transcript_8482/m.26458 type:complete len:329 (-) Transcript_8482:100-1086(-)
MTTTTTTTPPRVVVAGATGRVGRLVVGEVLERNATVTAVVRDSGKAAAVLPTTHPKLALSRPDLTKKEDVRGLVEEADCVVWCASGFSDAASPVAKARALLGLVAKTEPFDVKALRVLGEAVRETEHCRVVACSSAAVTRPAWSDEKKVRYKGASEIPIVRLNPLNILDVKRLAEDELRTHSGGRYVIARPTGLNDDWPRGRVVLAQGDLAVGRIGRADVAATLASLCFLDPASCNGKTFEFFSVAGYPAARTLGPQLDRLLPDAHLQGGDDFAALDASYALLQQLVPGETLRPQDLAMGQTYEQLDDGQTGRLGERGEENVPTFVRA